MTTTQNECAFEAEIQAKGLTAPRITPADLQAAISAEFYFTAHDGIEGAIAAGSQHFAVRHDDRRADVHTALLTFCVLVLQNGFTVVGKSACASPENFDAEMGRRIARQDAVSQLWPLLGFNLKQRLYEAAQDAASKPAEYHAMQPHQQRVVDEHSELVTKIVKLTDFFGTPLFAGLPEPEQQRLQAQAVAMRLYRDVLSARIAAF